MRHLLGYRSRALLTGPLRWTHPRAHTLQSAKVVHRPSEEFDLAVSYKEDSARPTLSMHQDVPKQEPMMMKIAIAGTNGLAQFLAYYLSQITSHNFVFLTRTVCVSAWPTPTQVPNVYRQIPD